MNTLFNKISFSELNAVVEDESLIRNTVFDKVVITLVYEMTNLGYDISENLYHYLSSLGENAEQACLNLLNMAKESVGAHVEHKIFYPNFPLQVMELSEAELFFNAIVHYWTVGSWSPEYAVNKRDLLNEENKKTKISLIKEEELKQYFFKILSSKDSVPESLNEFVKACLEKGWMSDFEGEVPFKETLVLIALHEINKGHPLNNIVKTTTDVLRLMAALSEQDIYLKEKIKFKSLSRKTRRIIVNALECVINIDDVKRHASLWIKAFHNLHIGEYKNKSSKIASLFRNQNNVVTFETNVFESIKSEKMKEASELLKAKPSVFARNLDKLVRSSQTKEDLDAVLLNFSQVAKKVESKILLQLMGHFYRRHEAIDNRLVFTSGKKGQALIASGLKALRNETINTIEKIIENALLDIFKEKNILDNKKIYISPEMKTILLPTQLSSTSESKKTIARGSKVPFAIDKKETDKDILRLFIYWKGFDVDLSAVFLKEDYSEHSLNSFDNLRNDFSTHSGDIVYAPNGASEFIDVNVEKALSKGVRFVAMDVRVYDGETFALHDICFAGYMLRNESQVGEIYEPTTVKTKFDLTSDSMTSLPCIFDLKKKEMIWVDASINAKKMMGNRSYVYHNTAKENFATTQQMIKSYFDLYKQKVSIESLIKLHAKSTETEIVVSKEDADFVIDFEGDLSPFDFAEINSKWI
ncbi:TPA: hypothetical protein ACQ30S_004112 [Yersinia enterocolitica]